MAKSKDCQNCGAEPGIPHHQPMSTLNGTEPTAADTRLVVVRTFRPDQKRLCQLCTEGRREMIRAQKKALAKAQRTQTAFWKALRELEIELGELVNGAHSLSGMKINDLLMRCNDTTVCAACADPTSGRYVDDCTSEVSGVKDCRGVEFVKAEAKQNEA